MRTGSVCWSRRRSCARRRSSPASSSSRPCFKGSSTRSPACWGARPRTATCSIASGERSRQARIQQAFYDIASLLAVPISQAETLRAVARAAAEALGGSSAGLLMPSEDAFELAAGHGLPSEVAALVQQAAAGGDEPL